MAKKGLSSESMVRQTMFSTGQVDEQVWKRTDASALYLSAAQALTNCEVGTTGLAKKRKGTQFEYNGNGKITAQSRGYELRDKNGEHYLIISGDGEFYVLDSGTERSNVVDDNGDFVVTLDGDFVMAFDGSVGLTQTISGTPYTLSELPEIDYTKDGDSLVLTHPNHPPARIYISSYATTPPTFAYEVLDISPYPVYDFNEINYSGMTVTFANPTSTTFTVVFSGAGADQFTSDWIGGQIVALGTSTVNALGYGNITAVTVLTPTSVQFDGNVVAPFVAAADMPTVGSQYIIRQPAWSDDLGWPAKVAYFQNRLWFANTKLLPDTVFGSQINRPVVFDVGTGKDTDAIVYTLGIDDSGQINWLVGGKQLEIFCSNMECACPQQQDLGLTPSTFSIRQQSAYGSSTICKPVNYQNDTYFVSKTGQSLIRFRFMGVGLAYESLSKSPQAQSLMKNPSNRALLRGTETNQDNFIYFANQSDNTLTNFQFANETKLAALTPSTTELDENGNSIVDIIDIVTVDNQVFMLKYYELSDTYTVEKMVSDIKMDSYSLQTMDSNGLITGLDRLEGYTVQILFEGQDYGQGVVSGGEVTADNPVNDAGTVQVGLVYDVTLRPMYFFSGKNNSPFYKNVSRIYVDYKDSLNFFINGALVAYQTFAEIQAGTELMPKTGTAFFDPVGGFERFATFEITQSSPFDLEILSVAYQVEPVTI